MKVWILFICFFATMYQARTHELPPLTPVDHAEIKQLIERNSGKVVLVNVWATWCKPCRKEIPALVKLKKEFHDDAFALLLVSADDVSLSRTKVQPMLKELGIDFPTYIKTGNDEEFITAMSSGWNGALPTSFLFDRDGTLEETMIGERTFEELSVSVMRLFAP